MLTLKRRYWRNWRGLKLRMFWPSTSISPSLGSISRLRWRTRVDLPEPDKPMMTNTSPAGMVSEIWFNPTEQPVAASTWALLWPACSSLSACGESPNTLLTLRMTIWLMGRPGLGHHRRHSPPRWPLAPLAGCAAIGHSPG